MTSSPAGIDCGATCSALFNYNTSVTLTATAASGSTFNGWSGSGCSGIGTCTVTVTAAASVTANFRLGTFYTLSVSINTGSGNGTIRQDVPFSATITDLVGNPLAGLTYTGGETYTITKVFTIFLPLILR